MMQKIPGNPIRKLETSHFLKSWMEPVRVVLEKHGCTLEDRETYCIITFPEGTYRTEILPRTINMRYAIFLPDGTEFAEIETRAGVNHLGFSAKDLPG